MRDWDFWGQQQKSSQQASSPQLPSQTIIEPRFPESHLVPLSENSEMTPHTRSLSQLSPLPGSTTGPSTCHHPLPN